MSQYPLHLINGLKAKAYSLRSEEAKDIVELMLEVYRKAKIKNPNLTMFLQDYTVIQLNANGETIRLVCCGGLHEEEVARWESSVLKPDITPADFVRRFEQYRLEEVFERVVCIIHKNQCCYGQVLKKAFLKLIQDASPEVSALLVD